MRGRRGKTRNGGRSVNRFTRSVLETRCFFNHALSVAIMTIVDGERVVKRSGRERQAHKAPTAKVGGTRSCVQGR